MISRRKFLRNSSLAAGVGLSSSSALFSQSESDTEQPPLLVKPTRLTKGDTIGLVTPASSITRSAFEKALENLDELGFNVEYSKNMRVSRGFLAGSNSQRIEDLHQMFDNSNIDGIVCARGGYGTARILPELDYSLIQANPKVLVGYSDITALLFGIYQKTGLVCFHGPVGASTYTDFTTDHFEKVLMKGKEKVTVRRPREWDEQGKKVENAEPKETNHSVFEKIEILAGKAQGQLVGGNLSLLVSLIGTPYDIDYTNKIVFIEEVGESLYRVDRMITQLLMVGKLQKAKGIALGVFKGCDLKPDDHGYDQSLSLKMVLTDLFERLNIPVLYGLPIGHIKDNATLPFGIAAELDTQRGTLTLLEAAVK